ncbi:MAG: 3-oxoacyl-[acyl-carrier-protein] synthase III C-terminal domain-containing protein [Kofleriaceae bacterium]
MHVALAMSRPLPVLTKFLVTRPRHDHAQAQILEWLAAAHAESEAALERLSEADHQAFAARIARALRRCGCGPDRIARRGIAIDDLCHTAWQDNALYDVPREPHGSGSAARSQRFAEVVDAYFDETYAEDASPPDDLIHVTCTGYVAPSGAQKLVARRGWGAATRVTHAYHMGCYASVPAVRIAAGFVAAGARRVDIAHTELCSLHLDPSEHAIEQLVVHSLFADGMIRYSMIDGGGGPGLRLLAVHECVVPDSEQSMSWRVADRGMQMTLARDVPARIADGLRGFVTALAGRAGRELGELQRGAFAVHPGGPKILDRVRDVLELEERQLATSRGVLRDCGNMSSATLPHIWGRLIDDPGVAPGALVASLAFGPGLTMCGAVFEKC